VETAAPANTSDEMTIEIESETVSQDDAAKPDGQTAATTAPEMQQPSLAELQNRFLRLAADFANYKRRNEAEKAEIANWARRELALLLLPVLDDFNLMIEYETQHPERLAEGAKLIRQKMMELLTQQGLEKIDALNQPYDYERHEAILMQPVTDEAQDHKVLSVVQDGYIFKGKVLRPSKVIVAQYIRNETATNSPSVE
jgi:molecular chaperone GrpE